MARRAASVSAGWACTLAVVFMPALAGCGQKGPLVLPAQPAAAPASAASAASAPASPR
ncbi:MAG: hypothetical protein JNK55_16025 [Rubrivivax sp.]|nr:hypothetical protein [Rubrivivax sp.]